MIKAISWEIWECDLTRVMMMMIMMMFITILRGHDQRERSWFVLNQTPQVDDDV